MSNSITITYQRLDTWPSDAPAPKWKDSPYSAGDEVIYEQLRRELRMRNASRVRLAMFLPERHIGASGLPLAKAPDVPRGVSMHPGVILTFVRGQKEYRFPAATWRGWRGNLRAIGETLERLRMVERDGVGSGEEQYAGYEVLPAVLPGAAQGDLLALAEPTGAHRIMAAQTLISYAQLAGALLPEQIIHDDTHIDRIRRAAVHHAHTDKGGSDVAVQAVNEARRILTQGKKAA
jgi:hypothetical protein